MSTDQAAPQITNQGADASSATPAVTPPVVESSAAPATEAAPAQAVAVEQPKDSPAQVTQPEAAKPVVPEKYDLKVPEGSLLDSVALEEISSYAKEKGYTQEQAQELLQRESDSILDYQQRVSSDHQAQVLKWKDQVVADKEIGGEAFNQNIEYAHRVLSKFAPKEFVDLLNKSGYGNHPDIVKTFVRIGKAMQPDTIIKSGEPAKTKSLEQIFYNQN